MWKCPKCGREFENTNQDHYCSKISTIDEYIAEQEESIRIRINNKDGQIGKLSILLSADNLTDFCTHVIITQVNTDLHSF